MTEGRCCRKAPCSWYHVTPFLSARPLPAPAAVLLKSIAMCIQIFLPIAVVGCALRERRAAPGRRACTCCCAASPPARRCLPAAAQRAPHPPRAPHVTAVMPLQLAEVRAARAPAHAPQGRQRPARCMQAAAQRRPPPPMRPLPTPPTLRPFPAAGV